MVDVQGLMGVLGRMERKLRARIGAVVRRGVISNSSSAGQLQTLQVKTLADDVRDDVEHMEPYGFTSHPPGGSEGVVLNVGGDTGHPIAINFGNRGSRPTDLEAGEVAIYHQNGAQIVLRNDGTVTLSSGASSVVVNEDGTIDLTGPGGPALAVARETDPVAPSAAMIAWAAVVEGAINGLAPGSFTGANSFAGTVSSDFATILSGGTGSTST